MKTISLRITVAKIPTLKLHTRVNVIQTRSFSNGKDPNPKLNIRPQDDRLDVGIGTDFAEEYDGRIYVDLVRKNRKRRNQPVIDVQSHFFPNQTVESVKSDEK
mmetsp:Transcript_28422/g.40112  ORF Transcript_28422/g.40112 Transcript_28422/m.40112 type:complete len:103 (+) Transcript_28422:153-461(+)|eukprot:CAMPEP_0168561324 /NCGR_PEP_ID=MMETSP0413-20121227/11534_1 /TAXON_ID=136452 /ORGANISM="Filamoeba nolandi, Strain NC-AS-23-1" /LENGTH=102 /DNA_ID=CAMNT_0008592687 /DNA_START=148 /DNA_END=456 /DNA_ORIENTATION=-